jgi:hypothetical protein
MTDHPGYAIEMDFSNKEKEHYGVLKRGPTEKIPDMIADGLKEYLRTHQPPEKIIIKVLLDENIGPF